MTELINSLFIEPAAKSISSIFFLVCLLPIFLQFNFLIILLLTLSVTLPSSVSSFFNEKIDILHLNIRKNLLYTLQDYRI
jgi:hypothetical protein